jgi:GntR family transcriptional regulator
MMEWNFNNETPIYLQIIDRFKMDIANGSLKPGKKVPSVRELALSAGVNPNTMQKALSELERDGYLESRRTSGRFVADMGNQADSLKNDLAHKLCSEFCEGMAKVGFTPEQSLTVYENYLKSLKKE